jgi:hypothetical protein
MDDIDALIARHKAFWQRTNDQPLLSLPPPSPWPPLQVPTPHDTVLPAEGYLAPEMLDPTRYFEQMTHRWAGLGPIDGDQFRMLTAYWYVPWLEAICGCPIWYVRDSGTMYAELPCGGLDAAAAVRVTRENPWLQKLREFYLVLRDLCGDRYPLGVAMPMRGPIDLLAALVGVEAMCLAFAESPQRVAEALRVLTDLWIRVVSEQIELLPPFRGGMAGCEQYGLWAPGTNAVTQCDLAVAISPRTYARFLKPCDERICASMEHPIIHLHSAAMHVLEPVLAVTGFAAIQVVVDPGPKDPTLPELLPLFRRVQAAGKPLIIHGTTTLRADLDALLAGLSPQGLCVRTTVV